MLRLVAADIGIRAEALLVKARQCVVQCINHSFHRPPAQLLNCIKELACERLEKAMKDQQAKDAKESEEKLLLELEAESSKPRKEDKEKDKRKKGKSKSKKGKKPGGAATYKPGEQPGTEHQEDEEVPREDAALDDSLAEMDEVEEDKQLAAVFPAPFSSASSVIASDMSVRCP